MGSIVQLVERKLIILQVENNEKKQKKNMAGSLAVLYYSQQLSQ